MYDRGTKRYISYTKNYIVTMGHGLEDYATLISKFM